MVVPKHINSKYAAIIYEDDEDGLIKARVSASGSMKPSGLGIAWKVTTLNVSDTAIKIPAAAKLAERNSIEIYNKSSTVTLYIGPDDTVTADSVIGTTSGKEIPPESYWSIDISDDIDIYGICPASETALIQVMEVA